MAISKKVVPKKMETSQKYSFEIRFFEFVFGISDI